MTSVVSFKMTPTPKQKRILNQYFGVYYKFYCESMKIVQKQMKKMYASQKWIEVNDMVRSVMMAPEFINFLRHGEDKAEIINRDDSSLSSLAQVRQYILKQSEEQYKMALIKLEKSGKAKERDWEREERRYNSVKKSLLKLEQSESGKLNEKIYREYLSKLKTIKFSILNSYHLNGGTGVPLESSVRFLLKPVTNKYRDLNNMYTSTVGEVIVLKMIVPSILSTFDRKVDNPKSKRIGEYLIPRYKRFNDFNTIQCGQFRGGAGTTTPFKINFEENKAMFYFPRRADNKLKGLKGKEKHVIKLKKYDIYRKNLIERNLLADKHYKETKDKSYWFFKYPTLIRKINRSGAVSYELQITYNGYPMNKKALGVGSVGISLSNTTVAVWSVEAKGIRQFQPLYPGFFEKKVYLANGKVFNGDVKNSQKYFLASGIPLTIQEAQKEFQRIQSQIEYEENKEFMEKVIRFDEEGNDSGEVSYRFKRGQKSKKIRSLKYFRVRNRAIGLMKASSRIRKQYYNIFIGSILEHADEIHLGRGKGSFSKYLMNGRERETDSQKMSRIHKEIRNFASSDFETILKNKLRNYEGGDKFLLLSDIKLPTSNINEIEYSAENYGVESIVQSDMYHAFLLAHTNLIVRDNGREPQLSKSENIEWETKFSKEEWIEFVFWSQENAL